jgi:tRNA A37 threonylcarbamoyladenosine biosynthesis protein TsaE
MLSYDTNPKIFHFDLYRLKNVSELENIGFFECLQNEVCIIEWPEIAMKFLPKNTKFIKFGFASGDENFRTVET